MLRVFLLFGVLTSISFAGDAKFSAQQWLEKMSQAMKVLEYQGTVAFFKGGRLDTMKYFHAIDNGTEQERLLSLNSPMREVIREAGQVRCSFKKSKQIVVNHRPVSESFIVNLPTDFYALDLPYHFSQLTTESVAMHQAIVILVKAKDNYRFDRKIWIDSTHFLPLKVEVYDALGATLEQVVYTELFVGQDVDFIKMEDKAEDVHVKHIHKVGAVLAEDARFTTHKIPLGFKRVFFTRMNEQGSGQPVEHLLLSDGFSSISVYLEIKSDDAQEGLQTLGSVNSFTHIVNDFQITAMGEVPAAAVQMVAQSITLRM